MTKLGLFRDLFLLANGVAVGWYEAVLEHSQHPYAYVFALSLIFGIAFLPKGLVDAFEIKVQRKEPKE